MLAGSTQDKVDIDGHTSDFGCSVVAKLVQISKQKFESNAQLVKREDADIYADERQKHCHEALYITGALHIVEVSLLLSASPTVSSGAMLIACSRYQAHQAA